MDAQTKSNIIKLIENSRDAVVCSIDENGFPNAKTMFRRKNEGFRTFWFSSNVSAIHTQQLLKNAKSCVYFCDPQSVTGIMLTGHMQVCTDGETKQLFWEKGDERYYSLGVTDPDYCILRFTAEKGNYMAQKKYVFSLVDAEDSLTYKYEGKWDAE